MNRIDRVTAILIQLQSRKVVKALDIASRFNISLRTVYRDINTLVEAGVPLIGEAGVGYSIVDGYRLPPVMFTKEEATAFLTAEKLVEKFTDVSTETDYKSAMYKVKAVLKNTEKDMLENMEEHIEVLRKHGPFTSNSITDVLPTVLKSISEKSVLQIRYTAFNASEATERFIEPIGIFYLSGYWHVIAFCRLRNDYRDFRADRMQQIKKTSELVEQSHPTLKAYLKQVAEQQKLETIVINVDRATAKYLQEVKYYYGFVNEKSVDNMVQMTFLTPTPDIFGRWYLTFADKAEIVSPEFLLLFLKEHLKTVSQKYL